MLKNGILIIVRKILSLYKIYNMIIDFSIDNYINKQIQENYSDKCVFISDDSISFFDMDEYSIGYQNPKIQIFDTYDDFLKSEEDGSLYKDGVSLVNNLSKLWVNGSRDKSTIYKLRG